MKTFIEQKADLLRQIEEIERENTHLFDKIDRNEEEITRLRHTLGKVGTVACDD